MRSRQFIELLSSLLVVFSLAGPAYASSLADQVVIHRDQWGVPHIRGESDAAVMFGSAWAQSEDHFWQLEDTYIKSIGIKGVRNQRGQSALIKRHQKAATVDGRTSTRGH
ncbi:MAG: penicillin acylase family protein [Pseudohongiellaceae bacterium]